MVALLGAACSRREPEPVAIPTVAVPDPNAVDPVALATLVTNPKFGDADPFEWTGRKPHSYPIHGIDISRWQGDIDWDHARSGGVSFAYIKATEGGDVVDAKFDTYWQGAKSAGLVPGIDGQVDLNLWRGSPEAWLRWAG
jgi:lysozyme